MTTTRSRDWAGIAEAHAAALRNIEAIAGLALGDHAMRRADVRARMREAGFPVSLGMLRVAP